MKLWLDDVRDPQKHGYVSWDWVKTADDAVEYLIKNVSKVTDCSLDHDLSAEHYPVGVVKGKWEESGLYDINTLVGTGYDVVLFLEENPEYKPDHIQVHSLSPVGAKRMCVALTKLYGETVLHRPAGLF